MRIPTNYIVRLAACLVLAMLTFATSSDIPPHGPAVVLFDGRDLKNFDIFLTNRGLNNDPE